MLYYKRWNVELSQQVPQHTTQATTQPTTIDSNTVSAWHRIVGQREATACYIDEPGVCLARGPLRSWESGWGPRSHTHSTTYTPPPVPASGGRRGEVGSASCRSCLYATRAPHWTTGRASEERLQHRIIEAKGRGEPWRTLIAKGLGRRGDEVTGNKKQCLKYLWICYWSNSGW